MQASGARLTLPIGLVADEQAHVALDDTLLVDGARVCSHRLCWTLRLRLSALVTFLNAGACVNILNADMVVGVTFFSAGVCVSTLNAELVVDVTLSVLCGVCSHESCCMLQVCLM